MKEKIQVQDVIEFNTELVKEVDHINWTQVTYQGKYNHILRILSQGPHTIDEVLEITQKTEKQVSRTTLYRQINELIEEGYVQRVGRRLKAHWTNSKILYGRTAYFFLPQDLTEAIWYSGADSHNEILAEFLRHVFKRKESSTKELDHLIICTIQEMTKLQLDVLSKIGEKINERKDTYGNKGIISDQYIQINQLAGNDGLVFFNLLGWITWILKSKQFHSYYSDLSNIFSGEVFSFETIDESIEEIKGSKYDLITYSKKPLYLISAEVFTTYLMDINYLTLEIILAKNPPLTIREISEQFLEVSEIAYKKLMDYKETNYPNLKVQEAKERSESTIYRNIQELIKLGLVKVAGRRIIPNQASTQILYTIVANKRISFEERDEFWNLDTWKLITRCLALTLQFYLGKKLHDYSIFHDTITKLEKNRFEWLNEVLININDLNLIHKMVDLGYYGMNAIMRVLGWSIWFSREKETEKVREQLLACFRD